MPAKKLVWHRHFYRKSTNCLSPALALWDQGQSGTAGHGLVWHCPALEMDAPCTSALLVAERSTPSMFLHRYLQVLFTGYLMLKNHK
jgi:hypothetical protein